MQTLRHARALARFVLALYVLVVGVAIASPLVQPQSLVLICVGGGSGVKLINLDAGGGGDDGQMLGMLNCPLCASVAPPPVVAQTAEALVASPLAYALRPIVAAHIAGRTAAPLPPRGPPAFS